MGYDDDIADVLPADAGDDGDALGILARIEKKLRDMIVGIFLFVAVRLPTWIYQICQDFFDWLGRALLFLVRFTVRLIRVIVVGGIWLALVFGPLAFGVWIRHSAVIIAGVVWAVVAFAGSMWGLYRRVTRHKPKRPK